MSEILESLELLEREKHINKEVIIEAIESSLVTACTNDFGKNAVVNAHMDRESGEISVFLQKVVVPEVEDSACEISLEEARLIDGKYELGDVVNIKVITKDFGRIAAQHARSVIVQKIKEEERLALFKHFALKEKDIVTGIVQRFSGKNICVSIDDKTDAILTEKEQVKGEVYNVTDRIKLYVVEVKSTNKAPKIIVSRTHPELVRKLFEKEVSEVADGTVEIKQIAREAGSRTKIAVFSNDPNVDPVGACVGINGARVNAIVEDLHGEKIDIICWNENPAIMIENALSPSNVIKVKVDKTAKSAKVVVPDYQLSLAIGKEGQNARLAAKLTGYTIDIKSESQAALMPEEFYMDEPEEEIVPEVIEEVATEVAEPAAETIEETVETPVEEATEVTTDEPAAEAVEEIAADEPAEEAEIEEASEGTEEDNGYVEEDFTIDDFEEADFVEADFIDGELVLDDGEYYVEDDSDDKSEA